MFPVSCLGIWWRHDIWISEKLKFDYLKNEKSFRSEVKNIFPCFTNALKKQTSKKVAETTFKLGAFAAASEFCEWVQVGIDIYIPHHKYQVKPHSSPWFSAACATTIVHRNHFFVCTNRINFLNLNESSNRLVIIKGSWSCAKFAYANKTKESITSQKLGSQNVWWICYTSSI